MAERTVIDHGQRRSWELYVVNCRTNHLHVIVGAHRHPDQIRSQFKAWCTRRLKEMETERQRSSNRPFTVRENWWAERGSRRYINRENDLEAAILYVRDGQDTPRGR